MCRSRRCVEVVDLSRDLQRFPLVDWKTVSRVIATLNLLIFIISRSVKNNIHELLS